MKKKLTAIFCFLFSFVIFAQTDTVDIGYILFKGDLSEYKDSSLTNRLLDEYSDKINQLLEENNVANIYIHGYTAIFPNGIDAMNLSQSRADKIKNELISRGVDKKFFAEVQGRGNTGIWGNNATDIARQPNRRVVISIGYDAKRIEDTTQAVNVGVTKKTKADSISKSDESFSVNWWIILWILLVILIVILLIVLLVKFGPVLVSVVPNMVSRTLKILPCLAKLFYPQFRGKKFVKNPFDGQGKLKSNRYFKNSEKGREFDTNYFNSTDKLGRPSTAIGHDIKYKNRPPCEEKLSYSNDVPKYLTDQLPDDQKGHLIGDLFSGAPNSGNLVPMNKKVNITSYGNIEKELKKGLRNGKKCSLKTSLIYETDSWRPSRFEVEWIIDGVKHFETIFNSI